MRGILVFNGGIIRTTSSTITLNGTGGSCAAADTTNAGVALDTNSQV